MDKMHIGCKVGFLIEVKRKIVWRIILSAFFDTRAERRLIAFFQFSDYQHDGASPRKINVSHNGFFSQWFRHRNSLDTPRKSQCGKHPLCAILKSICSSAAAGSFGTRQSNSKATAEIGRAVGFGVLSGVAEYGRPERRTGFALVSPFPR